MSETINQRWNKEALAAERKRQVDLLVARGLPQSLGISEKGYYRSIPTPYLNREVDDHFCYLLLVDRRCSNSTFVDLSPNLKDEMGEIFYFGNPRSIGKRERYVDCALPCLNPESFFLLRRNRTGKYVYWLLVHGGEDYQDISVSTYRDEWKERRLQCLLPEVYYERPLDFCEAIHLSIQFPKILESHELNIAGAYDSSSDSGTEFDYQYRIKSVPESPPFLLELGGTSKVCPNAVIPTSLNVVLPTRKIVREFLEWQAPHGKYSFREAVEKACFFSWCGLEEAREWLENHLYSCGSYTFEQKTFLQQEIKALQEKHFLRR